MAEIHAQAVIKYVERLPCSKEQKLKLISEVQKNPSTK